MNILVLAAHPDDESIGMGGTIKKLSKKLKSNYTHVTSGEEGSTIYNYAANEILSCPAFANKVIDKVGAGDAMLVIMSLCMKIKMPSDLALFLGSLAGATTVENIGNSKFINKDELLRQIQFSIK